MTTTASSSARFRLNRTSVMMMAIMVATQVGAFGLIRWLNGTSVSSGTVEGPSIGLWMAGVAVFEALLIIAVFRLVKMLPEYIRRYLKLGVMALFWAFYAYVVAYAAYLIPSLWKSLAILLIGLIPLGVYFTRDSGFRYLIFNLAAFMLSIAIVAIAGSQLGVLPVAAFLVAMATWDVYAVKKSGLMAELVEFSSSISLPNYYIIPAKLRVDMDAVKERLNDEREELPESVANVIGVGDFALPSLLVVASIGAHGVTSVPTIAASVGSVLSVGVLVASLERHPDGLPALPWVNSGALAGYIVGGMVIWL